MGEAEGRVRSRWERPYWPPSTGVPMRPPEYDRDFVKHLTDRLDAGRASNPRPLGWNSEKQESWLDDPGCACPVRDVSILRDRSVKTITRRLGLTTDDLTRDVDENGKKGWWTVTATGEPLPKILPLTLERLRQRVEGGEDSGSDGLDVGGCNCVNPDASVDAEIEGLVALPFPTVRGAA